MKPLGTTVPLNGRWLYLLRAFLICVALVPVFVNATADAASVGTPIAILGVLLKSKKTIPNLAITAYCGNAPSPGLTLDVPPPVGTELRIAAEGGKVTLLPQFYYLYGALPISNCTLRYTTVGKTFLTLPNVPVGGAETTDIVVTMGAGRPVVKTRREPQVLDLFGDQRASTPINAPPASAPPVLQSPTPNPCFAFHPPQGFSACMANIEPQFRANQFTESMKTQSSQNFQLAQSNVAKLCKGGESANCLRAKARLVQTENERKLPAAVTPKIHFKTGVIWFEHPPYDPKDYPLVLGGVDPDQHVTLAVCSVWFPAQHRQIIGKLLKGRCNYGWNARGFESDQYAFAAKFGQEGQWAPAYSNVNRDPNILTGPVNVVTGPSTIEYEMAEHPVVCQGDFRREETQFSFLGISLSPRSVVDHGMHIGEVFANGCGFEWGGIQTVGDGEQVYYVAYAPAPPAGPAHPASHPPTPTVRNCSIPAHLMACGTLLAPQQYPGASTNCPVNTHGMCKYETCTADKFTFPTTYCAAGR